MGRFGPAPMAHPTETLHQEPRVKFEGLFEEKNQLLGKAYIS